MPEITVDGTRGVHVVDGECGQRPCFRLFFDKGSFTQGVGYTSYYAKARPCCGTNHMSGCPHVGGTVRCSGIGGAWCRHIFATFSDDERPVPDGPCPLCGGVEFYYLLDQLPAPEPCCDHPQVAKSRAQYPPRRQRCKSCGTMLIGTRLAKAQARG